MQCSRYVFQSVFYLGFIFKKMTFSRQTSFSPHRRTRIPRLSICARTIGNARSCRRPARSRPCGTPSTRRRTASPTACPLFFWRTERCDRGIAARPCACTRRRPARSTLRCPTWPRIATNPSVSGGTAARRVFVSSCQAAATRPRRRRRRRRRRLLVWIQNHYRSRCRCRYPDHHGHRAQTGTCCRGCTRR